MFSPKFGTYIKGARLIYKWSNRLGSFMRMSPLNFGTRIELEPYDTDFCESKHSKKDKSPHFIWWQDENEDYDPDTMIDLIPCLRMVKRIKRRVVFDVDDNGEIIN